MNMWCVFNGWDAGSPKRWAKGGIFHPPGSARTISGIFTANWGMDYATDPTF